MLKWFSVLVVSMFLVGCATQGIRYVDLGDGSALRVVEVGNANALEPGYNITMLSSCAAQEIEKVTHRTETDDMDFTETITDRSTELITSNCKLIQIEKTASNGWLPGFVNSVLDSAGVAAAGFGIGWGLANADPNVTNVNQSADNSASGNAAQAQGQLQGQGQQQGQQQGQFQKSYNSNRNYNSNDNSNRNYNSNRNKNINKNRNTLRNKNINRNRVNGGCQGNCD